MALNLGPAPIRSAQKCQNPAPVHAVSDSHSPRSKGENTYDVKHKMALELINVINPFQEPLGA